MTASESCSRASECTFVMASMRSSDRARLPNAQRGHRRRERPRSSSRAQAAASLVRVDDPAPHPGMTHRSVDNTILNSSQADPQPSDGVG
jgi:hypothetical protein